MATRRGGNATVTMAAAGFSQANLSVLFWSLVLLIWTSSFRPRTLSDTRQLCSLHCWRWRRRREGGGAVHCEWRKKDPRWCPSLNASPDVRTDRHLPFPRVLYGVYPANQDTSHKMIMLRFTLPKWPLSLVTTCVLWYEMQPRQQIWFHGKDTPWMIRDTILNLKHACISNYTI